MNLFKQIKKDYKESSGADTREYKKLILHLQDCITDLSSDEIVQAYIESMIMSELVYLESSGEDEDSNAFVNILKRYI